MAGITLYAPNAKVGGGLLNVSFNSKDQSVWFRAQKQTGWNEQTKKGSFKDGASINCKMSLEEVSAAIRAIRMNSEFSFYHSFEGGATSGKLSFYSIPPVEPAKKAREGFGFTIKKDAVEIKAGLGQGTAELLAQYLEYALSHVFDAIYSEDKKEAQDRAKAKESQPVASVAKPPKLQEAVPVEDDDIF